MPGLSHTLTELVLYSRATCHLCDDARESIDAVLGQRLAAGLSIPTVREVDVDSDASLVAEYGELVPVIAIGTERLELLIGRRQLARMLERVLDGPAAA